MSGSQQANSVKVPHLPLLYLQEKVSATNVNNDESKSIFSKLPADVLTQCFTGYARWGDLAKLSNVHSSVKNIVRDAAEFGGQSAMWDLSLALLNGTDGLERNPELAVSYLKELAKDGNNYSPAMVKLGSCYLEGNGVEKNTKIGLQWLNDAATKGADVNAGHELALIYEYGHHGVEVDVVLAAKWFLHAAERDHVESMAEYAMCCELGCGVPQNDEDALEWYTKAANKGHPQSNFSVGEIFEEARGVPQSDTEACLWYYKAAVMGDEDSKKALKRLEDIARIIVPGYTTVLRN